MSYSQIIIKNNIRIYLSDLTDVAQEAIVRHQTSPLSSLGLIKAIATFGPFAIIKARGRTSIMLQSDGPFKNIIVESNSECHIRALIGNPNVLTDFDDKDINFIPIQVGIGNKGILKVVQEYNGENFGGEVELTKGDIVSDLAYYFHQSEQIYTAIVVDVKMSSKTKVARAYSVIFQMLPHHTEEDIIFVEQLLKNHKLSSMNLEEFKNIIGGSLIGEKDLVWKCNCSPQKMEELLNLIPLEEQKSILETHGKIEITCNFCNQKYEMK